MDLFPAMAKAHCRTLMFGIESGSQKILDRLKKEQTLEQTETAVHAAKKAGIEIVHGFFVVGNPDETEEDMVDTFDFASKLPLDTFAFNRLCVYRGTPLWKEYIQRGLVNDEDDWYKYFKCSSIDPTVLAGEKIHEIRSRELKKLIIYKFLHFPKQALTLTVRLMRNMPLARRRARLHQAVPRQEERRRRTRRSSRAPSSTTELMSDAADLHAGPRRRARGDAPRPTALPLPGGASRRGFPIW